MDDTPVYVAPALTALPFLAFNKHQTRSLLPALDFAEDYDAKLLLERFGSPLYVVSERQLRKDFNDFRNAFTRTGMDTRVAYSVKTNYLPAVISVLREEGAWAEVVSGMEYELVRALGTPAGEIIFNGPCKSREELTRAVCEGAIVNVDNFNELALLEQVVAAHGRRTRIGIRVSFDLGAASWVKFGFSDENGDSQRALERIARNPKLDLALLHYHGGTFVLVHELYAKAAERIVELAKRARDLGLSPTMADFGGGYPSSNTLKPELDFPGGSLRRENFWQPYADVIWRPLEKARELFGGRPTLVLEPGRAIVDASTQLLTTVTGLKKIPNRGPAAIVDAGVNLVPTACYYDHDVGLPSSVGGNRSAALDEVDVFGPLCMQTDQLRHRVRLPALKVGDPLVISHVGAYCHSQSMQFIHTRPATVLLGPDGPELIRRRETWRDVFALDDIPQRIRPDACEF